MTKPGSINWSAVATCGVAIPPTASAQRKHKQQRLSSSGRAAVHVLGSASAGQPPCNCARPSPRLPSPRLARSWRQSRGQSSRRSCQQWVPWWLGGFRWWMGVFRWWLGGVPWRRSQGQASRCTCQQWVPEWSRGGRGGPTECARWGLSYIGSQPVGPMGCPTGSVVDGGSYGVFAEPLVRHGRGEHEEHLPH